MRIRKIKNALEIVNNSSYVLNFAEAKNSKEKFADQVFGNEKPLHVEIGMGKGDFIIAMAKKYPDVNFVGIEMYESVVCRALKKLESEHLDNVKIICIDAIALGEIFANEIDTIYLNFSDPWPKKRHAKRRLTAETYLKIYDNLLKDNGLIIQKTDSVLLFESSIISLSQHGYVIDDISLDLHNSERDNVMTEYERKFSSQGIKINYLKAHKK